MNTVPNPFAWPLAWLHQLSRGWQACGPRTAQQQAKVTIAHTTLAPEPALLTVRTILPPRETAVGCLAIEGELNRHTYKHLVEVASSHYAQGWRTLLLDLHQTTQLELSGIFAFVSLAGLYRGQSLLDAEAGWAALHQAAEEITPGLGECVKLIAPSPAAAEALERANLGHFFTCYADLYAALKTIKSLPQEGGRNA